MLNKTFTRGTMDVTSVGNLMLQTADTGTMKSTMHTAKMSETIQMEPYTCPGDYETPSIVGNLKITNS